MAASYFAHLVRAHAETLVRMDHWLAAGTVWLSALFGAARGAQAQARDTTRTDARPPSDRPATPAMPPACCRIARIDPGPGVVTARETATGYTFRFAVSDRKRLAALKVGDTVWANFSTKLVRLPNDSVACCAIDDALPPP